MAGPVRQFMECDIVKVIGALECLEGGHRNEVLARHIHGLAMALSNIGASRPQELVGKLVARVGISHAHRLSDTNAFGQAFALMDVEHGVFAQHRD